MHDSVNKIKELAVLSDIMGEHIKLRRSGRNITCCCPFHDDRSPSMSISDERGFYHCFGCGASGDVFSFMQEYLGMSFKDALKELANRYGVELEPSKKKPPLENEALILLQEHFVAELAKNATALRYLHERGISASSIAEFNLGYAPSNAATIKILESAHIPPQTALDQGVIKRHENGSFYASFIERITFPISNENGELIGFGARTLNPNNPAKYVNSPACKLFDKKRIFYGYFAAKATIRKQKMMLVCEGYMDVIAFHQAGIKHAVAALGVAMGEEHLRLVSKDTFVRLCFDSDLAGRTAAFKAACLLARSGYNGDVISLAPLKDAGEFIQQGKAQQLVQAASLAGQNIIAYAMDFIFCKELEISNVAAHVGADPFVKKSAILAVLEFAAQIDKFLAHQHLELFSKRANLSLDELNITEILADFKNKQTHQPKFHDSRLKIQQPNELKWLPNEQINPLELSVLQFVVATRKDFSELLNPAQFCASALANELKNCRFDAPQVMEFAQFASKYKPLNIVGFLHNLALIYEKSNQGSKAALYARYAAALRACERLILEQNQRLKAAYLLLLDINASSEQEQTALIISKINQLGAK